MARNFRRNAVNDDNDCESRVRLKKTLWFFIDLPGRTLSMILLPRQANIGCEKYLPELMAVGRRRLE